MSLLDELLRSGALRTIDHALAQSLRRLAQAQDTDGLGFDGAASGGEGAAGQDATVQGLAAPGRVDRRAKDGAHRDGANHDASGRVAPRHDAPSQAAAEDWVLAGAALASLAVGHGHAAFDPAQPRLLVDAPIDWPAPAAWRAALAASRWVASPAEGALAPGAAPLVLEGGLLYLRRYREYERRLAQRLQTIASQPPATGDLAALAPAFARLFPRAGDGGPRDAPLRDDHALDDQALDDQARSGQPRGSVPHNDAPTDSASCNSSPANSSPSTSRLHDRHDRQARAAALALLRSLLLVTGGPGTGKTTTIARLLALLVVQAHIDGAPPPRIVLAAPTGRAAERMAESLRAAVAALRALPPGGPAAGLVHDASGPGVAHDGFDPALLDALPTTASTLHRLLGTIPDSPRFRHDSDNPLPYDVVVIDEASMVDLPLMCKLVEAVPDGARLILLGDPDQLPSVEAGDVLAGIVTAAGAGDGLPAGAAERLAPLLGEAAGVPVASGGLAGHRVHLQRGYRQAGAFELAPLAAAVRDGDADGALALLRGGGLAGVAFHEDLLDPLDPREATREMLLAHWRALAATDDPADALALAGRLRLLTALRDGPQGARGLNERIEEALAGRQRGSGYFHGRLLMISQNSYRHRLFNGDIGICLRDGNGALVAWFVESAADDAGGNPGGADDRRDGTARPRVRAFHPAALPAHESAFAMTVHKAQGSEFDSVWLQLPRQDGRGLSRELVYTALTRARRELHLCASEAVLRGALARHAVRVSGLATRLRAQ